MGWVLVAEVELPPGDMGQIFIHGPYETQDDAVQDLRRVAARYYRIKESAVVADSSVSDGYECIDEATGFDPSERSLVASLYPQEIITG